MAHAMLFTIPFIFLRCPGLGFRDWGSRFRGWGLGFRVEHDGKVGFLDFGGVVEDFGVPYSAARMLHISSDMLSQECRLRCKMPSINRGAINRGACRSRKQL